MALAQQTVNSPGKSFRGFKEPNLNWAQVVELLKSYVSWLAIIAIGLAIYTYVPYYQGFISPDTKSALRWLALAYIGLAPIGYYLTFWQTGKLQPSRGYLAVRSVRQLLIGYKDYLKNLITSAFYPAPKISIAERTNLLFMLVKLFFLPIMLNFLFANFTSVRSGINAVTVAGFQVNLASYISVIYPLVLGILLLVDTAYFTFGYIVESRFLNNKVVSVDPTFLGWGVALICYPPFNGLAGNYVTWRANDYAVFGNRALTGILYLSVLILMFVYASASVALGAKASNLTNRGIVSRWPYSFIRHPAYIAKNLAWWVTILPVFSVAAAVGMAAWSIVYFLRAITEERHLMMVDNGYKEYCRQVRWRFVPGIY